MKCQIVYTEKKKYKKNNISSLSAESVKVNKVNKYVSQRLPVSKNLVSAKEKGILQELFATRSAAQAFQNNKTANILRKEYLSL